MTWRQLFEKLFSIVITLPQPFRIGALFEYLMFLMSAATVSLLYCAGKKTVLGNPYSVAVLR